MIAAATGASCIRYAKVYDSTILNMKTTFIILFLITLSLNQKKDFFGEYNMYGAKITLNKDYTFEYNSYFDTTSFWTKGNWKVKNDTIYLSPILIYDTIRISGKKDYLRLSCSKKSNVILAKSPEEIYWPECNGQQAETIIKKVYYKKGKLFKIKPNGQLVTEKEKKILRRSDEYYNPWFTKK